MEAPVSALEWFILGFVAGYLAKPWIDVGGEVVRNAWRNYLGQK
jgi:hypothetical protein